MSDQTPDMPKAGDLIYALTLADVAYIGRFADVQNDPSHGVLVEALKVVTVPVPMQGPNGQVAVRMNPTLTPVNHLMAGPAPVALDLSFMQVFQPIDDQHPLASMYIKSTSKIEMVPKGFKLDIAPR
jgi:hypothetical protein